MAKLPVMSIAAAKVALDAICALVTASATIRILSGAQPATTLTAESGTLLSSGCTFGATPFAASTNLTSDGKATAAANAIANDTNAAASGTAGYFRVRTTTPTAIFQGNCGLSSADMILNTLTITAGDTIVIPSFKTTLACGDGVS